MLAAALSLSVKASYNVVVQRFTEHFVYSVNKVYESLRFHWRVQQPEESVDAFHVELMPLVKQCNYGSLEVKERLVRDRLVVGTQDSQLSDNLGRNPNLMLKDTWVQACQAEYTDKEMATTAGKGTSATPESQGVYLDTTKLLRLSEATRDSV